jgi:hypothetical protein
MEVLAAFLCERTESPAERTSKGSLAIFLSQRDAPPADRLSPRLQKAEPPGMPQDVRAAITVIGRRDGSRDDSRDGWGLALNAGYWTTTPAVGLASTSRTRCYRANGQPEARRAPCSAGPRAEPGRACSRNGTRQLRSVRGTPPVSASGARDQSCPARCQTSRQRSGRAEDGPCPPRLAGHQAGLPVESIAAKNAAIASATAPGVRLGR